MLSLPDNCDAKAVADIRSYFVQKVNNIYDQLAGDNDDVTEVQDTSHNDTLCSFSHVFTSKRSPGDVRAIIGNTSKTCLLYPRPTSLVGQCLDELLPAITSMINLPLQTGHLRGAALIYPHNIR